MGCTQSKVETDEVVARCKERRHWMKAAVGFRNAFAAAHYAYAVALKDTGAALSDFAEGEVGDLRPPSSAASDPAAASSAAAAIQPPVEASLLPPPPPFPSNFSTLPLQRAASMPEIAPTTLKKPPTPADATILEGEEGDEEAASAAAAADAESPPPPPPPLPRRQPSPPPSPPMPEPPGVNNWDHFIFGSAQEHMPPSTLSQPDEPPAWVEQGRIKKMPPAEEIRIEDPPPVVQEKVIAEPPPPKPAKKAKPGGASAHHQHAASAGAATESKRGRIVAAAPNLLHILRQLDDHFLKASESAHEVSKMLEATRMHYHSNFADNRGYIDHSARVMRVITWNRSFKGIPNADDTKDDFDNDESETHATILDKILAWEKKLYDEVKAGELMKIEYQRKIALLNKQKKRGAKPESLEKTKAAVSHLHTRYIVDMQSMDSTVSEINRLRDDRLYPKLVDLVGGMAMMWEAMHSHHGSQLKIIADLRAFDISLAPKETSESHHKQTKQLWQIVANWHDQLQKLMRNQKEYIKALNSWLKLNLIPIESNLKEKVSSPPRPAQPPIQALLHAWQDQLGGLVDERATNAIFSFSEVINTILVLQSEELQMKGRCEEARRDLMRKTRNFEDWQRKYSEKRAASSEEVNREVSGEANNDPVAERKFVVEAAEIKLKAEIEAYEKQCKHVREKSIGTLRTNLPDLFRAMSDFAFACSQMYKYLTSITQPQNPADN